ncbi:MAG: PEGA domain-containing protein [Gemmataceae bacterium]
MKPTLLMWCVALGACLGGGCVERRYVVTTEPPGVQVLRNGQDLGAAPVDDHFVYYGLYHFTLIKDGYEIQQIDQNIPTPWYEYPGLDFVSENLIPWKIHDVRRFHYNMQPVQNPNIKDVLDKAQKLQNHGKSLTPFAPDPAKPGVLIAPTQP